MRATGCGQSRPGVDLGGRVPANAQRCERYPPPSRAAAPSDRARRAQPRMWAEALPTIEPPIGPAGPRPSPLPDRGLAMQLAPECIAIGEWLADGAQVNCRHRYSPPRPARRPAPLGPATVVMHLRHRSCATIAPPRREAQRGCPQPVSDHPAGRGEATGPMPRPPQRLSPTPVADAMTGDRLRRLASMSAQLRAEVSARRRPPFQEIPRPSAPCPCSHGRPMKPQMLAMRSDRPSPVDKEEILRALSASGSSRRSVAAASTPGKSGLADRFGVCVHPR